MEENLSIRHFVSEKSKFAIENLFCVTGWFMTKRVQALFSRKQSLTMGKLYFALFTCFSMLLFYIILESLQFVHMLTFGKLV